MALHMAGLWFFWAVILEPETFKLQYLQIKTDLGCR